MTTNVANQNSHTRLYVNVGALDATSTLTLNANTRMLVNIGATAGVSVLALPSVGIGIVLDPYTAQIPPAPIAATRLYVEIT